MNPIKKNVVQNINPIMKGLGFKKSSPDTRIYKHNDIVLVLNLQQSMYSVTFMTNLGFYFIKNGKDDISKLKEYEGVYISFDIDCIDPSEIEGTGTPVEGGLYSLEILYFIKKLAELKKVGFELVELSPILDQGGMSNIVACNILWNFLALGLNKCNLKTKSDF